VPGSGHLDTVPVPIPTRSRDTEVLIEAAMRRGRLVSRLFRLRGRFMAPGLHLVTAPREGRGVLTNPLKSRHPDPVLIPALRMTRGSMSDDGAAEAIAVPSAAWIRVALDGDVIKPRNRCGRARLSVGRPLTFSVPTILFSPYPRLLSSFSLCSPTHFFPFLLFFYRARTSALASRPPCQPLRGPKTAISA